MIAHKDLVKEAFMQCFSAESDDARERLLAQLESENPAIAAEVKSLLKTSKNAGAVEQIFGFAANESLAATSGIGPQNIDLGIRRVMPEMVAAPGTMIGPYKLLEQIGEGGMGSVFMAQQSSPIKRRVALKIIKPGMDSQHVVARFEAERQALAMMDHSNIAKVLDAGTTQSGLPFFVMELVKGLPITEYCELEKLTIKDRLKLFIDLCRGVQHAHQKGIIHRDLKPSNVLVTLHDGKPVVKIIDFGIAKAMNQDLTDRTLFTQFAQMIGTPLYMSPEQAALSGMDVDTRSDVYSLGVLLYELLTGTTPFDKAQLKGVGIDEVRRMIRETEPPRPSQRLAQNTPTLKAANDSTLRTKPTPHEVRTQRELQGELDWIVMKALEKERNRRYESPSAFAEDVERFLIGEPVLACPPTLLYRLRSYSRRNRKLLTATSLIAVTALIGSAISLWYANQASLATQSALSAKTDAEAQAKLALEHSIASAIAAEESLQATKRADAAKQTAVQERLKAEHILYTSDLRLAASQVNDKLHSDAFRILLRQSPKEVQIDHRSWEWYYLLNQANRIDLSWLAHNGSVRQVDWSPDGRHIATASEDGSAGIWDATNGRLIREWRLGNTFVTSIKWSLSGKQLAWGSASNEGILRVWDDSSDSVVEMSATKQSIWSIAWNQDGSKILTGSIRNHSADKEALDDRNLNLWKKLGNTWELESSSLLPNNIASAGWNSMQDTIAATDENGCLRIFAPDELKKRYEVSGLGIHRFAWSPTPSLLVYSYWDQCVVYDVEQRAEVKRFRAHNGPITAIAWSPDGNWLVTGGNDGIVKVWGTNDWTLHQSHSQHEGSLNSLCWNADSDRIVSASGDQFVNVFSLKIQPEHYDIEIDSEKEWDRIAWTPRRLIRGITKDSNVVEVEPKTGALKEICSLPDEKSWRLLANELAINLVGEPKNVTEIACIGKGEHSVNWDQKKDIESIWCASVDGTQLFALASYGASEHLLYDVKNRRRTVTPCKPMFNQIAAAISPSGKMAASVGRGCFDARGSQAGWIHLYELKEPSKHEQVNIGGLQGEGRSIAWSPDSQKVVAGNVVGFCSVFDVKSLQKLASNHLHRASVDALAWHPNGKRIASGGEDCTVKIWDANSGVMLLSLPMEEKVRQLEWSLDGLMLAARDASDRIRIWDATEGYQFAESRSYRDRMQKHLDSSMIASIEIEDWPAAKQASLEILEYSASKSFAKTYLSAVLCVVDNDLASYRKLCDEIALDYPKLEEPSECFFAGWTLCISPTAFSDYSIAIGKAIASVEKHPSNTDLKFVLGSLLMRAGKYSDAARYLEMTPTQRKADSKLARSYQDYFLAMNSHQLGDPRRAAEYLKSAEVASEEELKTSPSWNRKLMIRLLKEQAIELCSKPDR